MATLKKCISAQTVLEAHFDFTMADAMVDTAGATTNFKATTGVFDVIPLPVGAQVVGGDVTILVVSNDSGTSTLKVGDSVDDDRYTNETTTDLKTLGRFPIFRVGTILTNAGYQTLGEAVRLTLANNTGDATTGSFRVSVQYIVNGRQSENLRDTNT